MNPLFADTYYFLALLHKGDAAHPKAVALAERLSNPIVTTAWVLTEVGDALSAPGLRPMFVRLVETLRGDTPLVNRSTISGTRSGSRTFCAHRTGSVNAHTISMPTTGIRILGT